MTKHRFSRPFTNVHYDHNSKSISRAPYVVSVEIDEDKLADLLFGKAHKNTTGKTRMAGGAIKATVTPSSGLNLDKS